MLLRIQGSWRVLSYRHVDEGTGAEAPAKVGRADDESTRPGGRALHFPWPGVQQPGVSQPPYERPRQAREELPAAEGLGEANHPGSGSASSPIPSHDAIGSHHSAHGTGC
jgi:hypothetical protein